MIRSMTAFARLSGSSRKSNWVVEIRSLNNRFFDLSLRLPPALVPFENQVRELIQTEMRRGKVSVNIAQEYPDDNASEVTLNEVAVDRYVKALRRLTRKHKLQGDLQASDLIRIPGIFEVKKEVEEGSALWNSLKSLLQKSLKVAHHSKEVEGHKLILDVNARLELVVKALERIKARSAGKPESIARKLQERLKMILKENQVPEDERFHREIAYLVEKTDITEEVVRLKSHLDLFFDRLKAGGEIGRELDFLCQEMNREVNTIGSKSQLFEISTEVVLMKGELEKIREQIQNIE